MADITVTEHLLLHQKMTPQATGMFTGLLYDPHEHIQIQSINIKNAQ